MNSNKLYNLNLQIFKYNEDLQKMKDYYLAQASKHSQALLLDMSEKRRAIGQLKKKLAEERKRALAEERKRALAEERKRAFFAKYKFHFQSNQTK